MAHRTPISDQPDIPKIFGEFTNSILFISVQIGLNFERIFLNLLFVILFDFFVGLHVS